MKEMYNVKYKVIGQWFWKTLKDVKMDGIEERFRWFHLDDDSLVHLPIDTVVVFPPHRQKVIEFQMSKVIGQPISRV